MNMRKAIATTILVALVAGCGGGGGDTPKVSLPTVHSSSASIPSTGTQLINGEALDESMRALLKKWNIPGAALAITKDGRLVYAKGFGYADVEAKQLVQPDSMFRIASISKVLTAIAVLQLKDQNRLSLDDKVLDRLPQYSLQPSADARLRAVTIRHLLQHSGGWDRDASGDPPFMQRQISDALNVPTPVLCPDIARYMLGRPLDFTPGTRYAYSNFGYCLLGLVVETVTGEPYELYVRNRVLAAMSIQAMSIGYVQPSRRGPYEVRYYEYDGAPLADSLFPGEGKVPWPYGGYELSTHGPGGGWIASAIDLTRVMNALDGRRGQFFLSAATMTEFTSNPHLPGMNDTRFWYGLGIQIGSTPDTWSHGGSLPGARSFLAHRPDGYDWTIVANSRSTDGINGADLATDMVAAVSPLLNGVTDSSGSDLYPHYPSPILPPRYP